MGIWTISYSATGDLYMTLHKGLLLSSCVAFGLATIGVGARVNLVALGLFLWSLSWFF